MSEPTPTTNGVWIPLPFAHMLFECYYGDGPRSRGRTDSTIPPKPTPEQVPLPPRGDPIAAPIGIASGLAGFTPRGAAARAYTPVTSPPNPPPTQREGDGAADAGR